MEAMRKSLRPDQPAKLAVALAASDVSGQIFGAQAENLMLYSQPRPIETVTAKDTWSVESILADVFPQMRAKFTSLGREMAAPPPETAKAS
jgi:hypothetical protein